MAEFKHWRNTERAYLKDVIPLDTPYNVCIETSTLCNLNCIYCAHSKHLCPEANMGKEMFERIVDDLKEFPRKLKKIELYFFGEPLCNPDLAWMIQYVRNAGITETIDFTTNGLLFNRRRIDELNEHGMPDHIRISLQGLDADAYWKYGGVHMEYASMLDNLRYLYEHKAGCRISMKVADIAIKDIYNGKQLFEEMFGDIADTLFVESIIPIYGDIDYDNIDAKIKKNVINGRENIEQNSVNKVCHRPFYRLAVRLNGDVTAACCDQMHDITFGNIYDETIVNIWNGSKRTEFLKMMLRGDRFKHPYCCSCVMPNDITTEADLLDPYAKDVLERI